MRSLACWMGLWLVLIALVAVPIGLLVVVSEWVGYVAGIFAMFAGMAAVAWPFGLCLLAMREVMDW